MVLGTAHFYSDYSVNLVVYRCSQERKYALVLGIMGTDSNADAITILFSICSKRLVRQRLGTTEGPR